MNEEHDRDNKRRLEQAKIDFIVTILIVVPPIILTFGGWLLFKHFMLH